MADIGGKHQQSSPRVIIIDLKMVDQNISHY
jgi:hypothetical protein